jgi:hypothetical protein
MASYAGWKFYPTKPNNKPNQRFTFHTDCGSMKNRAVYKVQDIMFCQGMKEGNRVIVNTIIG